MPGYLLHVGATVMCMHGGQAQATAPILGLRLADRRWSPSRRHIQWLDVLLMSAAHPYLASLPNG